MYIASTQHTLMIRRAKPDELYVSGHALQDTMYICMYTCYVYRVRRPIFCSQLAQPSISVSYINDRTMAAVKQELTDVNAEIPVVEGKSEEYVCFLAHATIANSGMEASEGSSWARDWHGFVQKLKSGTATLSEFEQLDKLELLNHGRKYKKKAQDHAGSQCLFVVAPLIQRSHSLGHRSHNLLVVSGVG